MKYTKYGITIIRLKEEDIEMVRQWRNAPHIVSTMEYRDYITPEMQKAWFKSVSNLQNFYFVIVYQGEKMGVINAKNIDWTSHQLESGIFIPDQKYVSTFVPAIVSIMLTEMFFRIFGWDECYAHVLKTNTRAIQFNKTLGYLLCENQENAENQLYILKRENFERRSIKLKKALKTITGAETGAVFQLEPEEFGTDLETLVMETLPAITWLEKTEENAEGRFYYLKD